MDPGEDVRRRQVHPRLWLKPSGSNFHWVDRSFQTDARTKSARPEVGIASDALEWPVLRDVVEADLDALYEHQREPEANRMALFPARDREGFYAHWRRILADDSVTKQTIVYEGQVAGNVLCWSQDGQRLVGYWVGREFWGRGLATHALAELLDEVTDRPLHAWVATSNVASIRVLEKCGFVAVDSRVEFDKKLGERVEELLLELAAD